MGNNLAVPDRKIIDHAQTNTLGRTEVLMHTRSMVINGERVMVFDPSNVDELGSMVSWCRQHIGRSRGDSTGTWWIVKIPESDKPCQQRRAIAMKHGPHLFIAQLTWA
jgi:hypothetical protein